MANLKVKQARLAGIIGLIGLLAIAPLARAAGAAGPATAAVKSSNDSIRAAVKGMVAARGTPGWATARAKAREAVGSLLDFDTLAKSTLGTHWVEITPAQRTAYVSAMRSAMEANYLQRMQGKVAVDDVQVDYLGEDANPQGTLVHTHFSYGTDGAKIDFLMAAAKGMGKKLRAIDVITEDVSLADTYREQIAGLWPKKGIDGVTQAFEKKAKRLESDLESTQTGAAAAPAAGSTPAPAAAQ